MRRCNRLDETDRRDVVDDYAEPEDEQPRSEERHRKRVRRKRDEEKRRPADEPGGDQCPADTQPPAERTRDVAPRSEPMLESASTSPINPADRCSSRRANRRKIAQKSPLLNVLVAT